MSEEKSTLQLILEFNLAAIAIPAVVFFLVYAYSVLFDVHITKQIWKTVLMIAWGGTLLVFFREFLKTYLAYFLKARRRKKQLDKTIIK